jgi:cell division protease FtsH
MVFPRRLSRGLDRFALWWAKHQRWWWIGIVVFMAVWTAYDVGQMVARASVLAGSQDIRGTMSVPDLRKKVSEATGGAGRLIIVSQDEARYIDSSGAAWVLPSFGRSVSQDDMTFLTKNHVAVDGSFQVFVRPIKTRPEDLLVATASDLLIKLLFILAYGFIAFFLLRMGRSKNRFTRVGGPEATGLPEVADVAGYESVKNELLEVVDYLRDPARFEAAGARPPRGILLYGPPGNGKTMMAKALAGEASASFFEQSASSFQSLYVGEGARSVRALFAEARRCAPSVVFIDEIDSIGGHRGAASHDERVQTLDAILTEMDGFGSGTGVVVVAATNRLNTLDEALVRPGRFDRKVFVGLPTKSDREAILLAQAARLPSRPDVDWPEWARRTGGMSGADLAALVNEAAIEAARASRKVVTDADLSAARDRVWIGAVRSGSKLSPDELHTVAIHELGHAWMTRKMGRVVDRVSIRPRGQALGVTLSQPEDDRTMTRRDDVVRDLLILMGGRAAEQILLGRITGGSADDIDRASVLARAAVQQLGGTKWGAYVPDPRQARSALNATASALVNEALARAEHECQLAASLLARAVPVLLDREELDTTDLDRLWGVVEPDRDPVLAAWNVTAPTVGAALPASSAPPLLESPASRKVGGSDPAERA